MKKRKPHPMMIFKKHRPTGSSTKYLQKGPPNKITTYRNINGIMVETDKAGYNHIIVPKDDDPVVLPPADDTKAIKPQ